jgi:K+-transporting ATPase c subunit
LASTTIDRPSGVSSARLDSDQPGEEFAAPAPKVAGRAERGTDQATIERLVDQYTTGRWLGFMGGQAVSVLELNLALDREFPATG